MLEGTDGSKVVIVVVVLVRSLSAGNGRCLRACLSQEGREGESLQRAGAQTQAAHTQTNSALYAAVRVYKELT